MSNIRNEQAELRNILVDSLGGLDEGRSAAAVSALANDSPGRSDTTRKKACDDGRSEAINESATGAAMTGAD